MSVDKINPRNHAVNAYSQTSIQGSAPARPPERANVSSDTPKQSSGAAAQVEISRQGRELAAASQSAIKAAPEGVDSSKIDNLKQRIASGDWQPNAQTIAKRILDVEA